MLSSSSEESPSSLELSTVGGPGAMFEGPGASASSSILIILTTTPASIFFLEVFFLYSSFCLFSVEINKFAESVAA